MSSKVAKKSQFVWDDVKLKAAEAIAKGDRTQSQIATELNTTPRTLQRWQKHPDFQLKVDEIIADIDIAQKAERIKIAKKVIRQKLEQDKDKLSKKDLLDWLKYVGEEVGDYEPKHQVTLNNDLKQDIITDPETRDLANQLLKRIAAGDSGRVCTSGK